MRYAPRVLSVLVLLIAVRPGVASAELVLLTTGRTLTIRSHVDEGDRVVLRLQNGDEVVCDRSLIVRIEPDAAPPPEPILVETTPVVPDPPYADIIDTMSVRHGVDPALVTAAIAVESAYRPNARSPKGAMGLMQLMPATASQYALVDPFDPTKNIEAGTRHLRSLLERYDVDSALAAYNAGEGSVQRYGGVPPYPETLRYVSKVRQLLDTAAN